MNWESIRKEYETSTITLKALAEKHDIKDTTLRSRKNREKWQRNNATQRKNVATQNSETKQSNNKPVESLVESCELNDKQRLFCMYYLKYFNATKAYQKAYGCAYSTAMVEGHRHLRNPKIDSEISRMKAEQTSELKLDSMKVLQTYIDIAFADITDYTVFGKKEVPVMTMYGPLKDEDGNEVMKEVNYVDFKESDRIDGTIVTEVKQGKDGVAIKLADKMKALDFLANYTEMLPEHVNKKLQQEKIKTDIEKTKAEIEHISDTNDDEPIEIVISRKSER